MENDPLRNQWQYPMQQAPKPTPLSPEEVLQLGMQPVSNAITTYAQHQQALQLQREHISAVAASVAARDAMLLQRAREQDASRERAASISEKARQDWQQQKGVDDRAMAEMQNGKKLGTNLPPFPKVVNQQTLSEWASAAAAANDAQRNGVLQPDGTRKGGLVQQAATFYTGILDRQAAIQEKMNELDSQSLDKAKAVVQGDPSNLPGNWVQKNVDPASPEFAAWQSALKANPNNPFAALAAANLDGQYTESLKSQIPQVQSTIIAKTYPAQAKIYSTALNDIDSTLKAYQSKFGGSDIDHEAIGIGYANHVQNTSVRHQQEAVQMVQAQAKALGLVNPDGTPVVTPEQLTAAQNAAALKTKATTDQTASLARKTAYESAQAANANSLEQTGFSGKLSGAGDVLKGLAAPVMAFIPGTQANQDLTSPQSWANVGTAAQALWSGTPSGAPTPQQIAAFAASRGYQIGPNGQFIPHLNNLVLPPSVAAPTSSVAQPVAPTSATPVNNLLLPPMPAMPGNPSAYNYDQNLRLIPTPGAEPVSAGAYPSAVGSTISDLQQNNNSPYNVLRQ